jgi:uncharacterized protein YkwD
MTFDELYASIMEQGVAPGLTIPTIPKMSLAQQGSLSPTTNVSSTSQAGTSQQKTTTPNTPQSNQQSTMDKQTNAMTLNTFKKVKDLEKMVNDMNDQLRKAQGLPPAPKKPSIMSDVINPQVS